MRPWVAQLAASLAQRDDAFEAADEPHIELRARPRAQEFAQLRENEIVACIHGQRRGRRVENLVELLFDLGRGAFQMR